MKKRIGKLRHIDVQYLWTQDELNDSRLKLTKVGTKDNPADIFTKPVSAEVMNMHLKTMGVRFGEGRARTAPRLQGVHQLRRRQSMSATTFDYSNFML